jgi:hypothetical protein
VKTLYGRICSLPEALKEAGVLVARAGLQGPGTATTLRREGGKRLVQDGPYAETKEQLAGFFVIDVPDLDTALEWAARLSRQGGRRAAQRSSHRVELISDVRRVVERVAAREYLVAQRRRLS